MTSSINKWFLAGALTLASLANAEVKVAHGVCRFFDQSLAAVFSMQLTPQSGQLPVEGKIWNPSDTRYKSVRLAENTADRATITLEAENVAQAQLGDRTDSLSLELPHEVVTNGGVVKAQLTRGFSVPSCQGHDCDYWFRPDGHDTARFAVDCRISVD